MVVRKPASGLENRTTTCYASTNAHLELEEIIQTSFCLEQALACSHSPNNPLKGTSREVILIKY